MVDLISVLSKTFELLDTDYAYFDLITMSYKQEKKTVKMFDCYFDFKHSGFLHWKYINKNREVLFKLDEYKENNLICTQVIKNGFSFTVINTTGQVVYKDSVLLFNELNWIQKIFLKRKFDNLVTKAPTPFLKG